MKAPSFQFYAGDFFVDTFLWSNRELGAYVRLLSFEWTNGPLPNDLKKLGKIAMESPENMAKIWHEIGVKFEEITENLLVNSRLEETRERQLNYVEQQRKRADKRWHKDDATAYATAMQTPQCSPSSTPSSTTKKKKNIGATSPIPTPDEVKEYCKERNNGVDPEKWFDHYSARGWMIGKNKMKDWRAAVRTWERNEFNGNGEPPKAKQPPLGNTGQWIEKAERDALDKTVMAPEVKEKLKGMGINL